ncbi:MAG: NAD(+) synthase [Lachnospiraceae bacterium]|nr:NAD(+) synthase [Lachnospiraceae bacterium]
MIDGFIKAAALSIEVSAAQPDKNKAAMLDAIGQAAKEGAKIIALPEFCVTGATAGDAMKQRLLLDAVRRVIGEIAEYSAEIDALIVFGAPVEAAGRLYNAAVMVNAGDVIGIVPKYALSPEESRWFSPAPEKMFGLGDRDLVGDESPIPVSANLLARFEERPDIAVGVFFDEDWDGAAALHEAGASLLIDLCAKPAIAGSCERNKTLLKAASLTNGCAIVRAAAGPGESVTDCVYDGQNMIAVNGELLAAAPILSGEAACAVFDLEPSIPAGNDRPEAEEEDSVEFYLDDPIVNIDDLISRQPFLPAEMSRKEDSLREILAIQSTALIRRMKKIWAKRAVIGISGGLDSTLALIAAVEGFKKEGWDLKNILAVTMPCFGTSTRTFMNACDMARCFGVTLREIHIGKAVIQHLNDIGHDPEVRNAAYENAQARERTQVLMDLANDVNGIVVGTGDLSELALGWATYNGDHMSMYGVNAGIPKTVIRELVTWYASSLEDEALKNALLDVVATPVSPELLPAKDGQIAQKTEDLVGPYELHDFFIYHALGSGFMPDKILRMAKAAFGTAYTEEELIKWLRNFYDRFFKQQFKRSCMPDGPQAGPISLSPRGSLKLPSDTNGSLWTEYIDNLKN